MATKHPHRPIATSPDIKSPGGERKADRAVTVAKPVSGEAARKILIDAGVLTRNGNLSQRFK